MQAPLDYAANDADPIGVEAGDITYAALLDRHAAKEPITDEMIRRACLRMEAAQSWPSVAASEEAPRSVGGAFYRLLRVLR